MSEIRLIDANALKKSAYPFPCAIGVEYAVPIRAVDDAPTIDPVRHGQWEAWNGEHPRWLGCFCSVCGNHADSKFAFCPNCGARMDAEEENNG